MNLEKRTIEILSQVVLKEMCADQRDSKPPLTVGSDEDKKKFWNAHKENTLELARNILRIDKTINPLTK